MLNWPPRLGWYPADLDEESIARHRADAARKKTDRDPAKKWAHLTELARQREVEQRGRERWPTFTSATWCGVQATRV